MAQEGSGTKAVKSGLWYVLSNVLIRAVGIITAPIYTRLLTTAETGYANNFNNYVSIFTVVTCLCLIYSVGRAKLDFKDEFDAYMSSIQTLSSLFGLVILTLVMIFSPAEGWLGYPRYALFLMFLVLTVYPSVDYQQYKYRFEWRYRENIAISVILTILTVFLSIGLIFMMPEDKGFAKILGTVIPELLLGGWCYFNIVRKGRCFYRKEYWRYALSIGLPMIPHGLALILLARMDTSMISRRCTMAEVGLYTSGYTIGTLLMFITNAVGNAWLPWFNERLYAEDREAIREKNRLLMEGGTALTLLFIAFAPLAVRILLAKSYRECMWVVPPVALGTLCQYFYTNYVNVELFYKKTAMIAVNSIIAAGVNYVLNAVFIEKYGYIAAAFTTLFGYAFLNLLHFICTRLILKKKIYADGYYFLLLFAAILGGLLLMLLYKQPVIRYGITLILALVLAIRRKNDILKLKTVIVQRFRRQEKVD
ncbi:MAG: oligosaccharide flippase family protein [Lachnospiraceae bacterium]|nr:oligosaccharide flippase family protein [Lachnospiraceae bacterium]